MIIAENNELGIQGPLARLRGCPPPPPAGLMGLGQTDKLKQAAQDVADKAKTAIEEYGVYFIVIGGLIGVAGTLWLGEQFRPLAITVGGFLLAAGLVPLIIRLV